MRLSPADAHCCPQAHGGADAVPTAQVQPMQSGASQASILAEFEPQPDRCNLGRLSAIHSLKHTSTILPVRATRDRECILSQIAPHLELTKHVATEHFETAA
jgi:hypothetical protein